MYAKLRNYNKLNFSYIYAFASDEILSCCIMLLKNVFDHATCKFLSTSIY